ncbi:acyl-CoA dehydrogenase [Rhodovarius crocodyli]|uniref:Acyl-CoA dehydrogenase n=1 Tax=Rhodovarius crocodyli TaxID=1979269 RepID=A0A437MIF3_9PROT|nr:acyl-CoA dehydrogenase family protein [Rhodovarius crocodyli]RVT97419.1 acyl-CoA dehydrogenase [Rhodovarius crocodyli]
MPDTLTRPALPGSALLAAIAAEAPARDRDAGFPFAALARLHEAGLLALTVPRALGGAGAGLAQAAETIQALGAACPATALVVAMQLSKHAALARGQGFTPALRESLGRLAVTEGALLNSARAEPELGSPTRGGLPATTARRGPKGWLITGRKRYVTGAPGLRFMEVVAATAEDEPRIGSFLVPANAPGVQIVEAWNHLGLRASGSHDVVFRDVPVPYEHVAGLAPAAAWGARDDVQAAWNAVIVSAVYLGVAEAARDWVLAFLNSRQPSGLPQPLSALATVQQAVGEIELKRITARRLIRSLAQDADAGLAPVAAESGAVKAELAKLAIAIVDRAASLAGNHALDRANPLERHWRDVQCARVHVPTEDAAAQAAGRFALAGAAA